MVGTNVPELHVLRSCAARRSTHTHIILASVLAVVSHTKRGDALCAVSAIRLAFACGSTSLGVLGVQSHLPSVRRLITRHPSPISDSSVRRRTARMTTMIAAGSIYLASPGRGESRKSLRLGLAKARGWPSLVHAFGTPEYAPVFPQVD